MKSVSLENGKYELRFDETSGALCAYRYGEPWQDFTGNKFIYLLMEKALAAAEAQPAQESVACQHKRQKWAINMRTGSCSDCGATFVFGRNGEPEKWSAPAATTPPQPVPLPDEQKSAIQQWLDFGEQMQQGGHQQGYFSRGGWAYDTLRGIGGKS